MFPNLMNTIQEAVLDHGDFWNSTPIRSAFIGEHLEYKIEDCQKVICHGSVDH
jgi:hypothetical protein